MDHLDQVYNSRFFMVEKVLGGMVSHDQLVEFELVQYPLQVQDGDDLFRARIDQVGGLHVLVRPQGYPLPDAHSSKLLTFFFQIVLRRKVCQQETLFQPIYSSPGFYHSVLLW